MKCHVCGEKAALCFSNWPDPGEICFCEKHCSDTNLHKAQQRLYARAENRVASTYQEKTKKAG